MSWYARGYKTYDDACYTYWEEVTDGRLSESTSDIKSYRVTLKNGKRVTRYGIVENYYSQTDM